MRLRGLLFWALVALFTPPPVHAQNSGLTRLTDRDDLFGWEAVGRVDMAGKGTCTGTLIAPDQVLTAAHCIVERGTWQPIDPARITFRAGLRDGIAVAERRVKRAVIHRDYRLRDVNDWENALHDLALLELETPIPTSAADPFVVDDPSRNGTEVSVVSYAQGRNEALSRQRRCTVLGKQAGFLAFDCDVWFGSSGAPVLQRSSYRSRIVSIVSRGGQTKDGMISLGMELPQAVADLKRALRSGRGVLVATEAAPARQGGKPAAKPLVRRGAGGTGGAKFLRP